MPKFATSATKANQSAMDHARAQQVNTSRMVNAFQLHNAHQILVSILKKNFAFALILINLS
jgi:hypothetical protein